MKLLKLANASIITIIACFAHLKMAGAEIVHNTSELKREPTQLTQETLTPIDTPNALAESMEQVMSVSQLADLQPTDWAFKELQSLVERYSCVELATLRGQVEALEDRTVTITQQQFSTTTKLSGQVIFAGNAGGFGGDRIVDPRSNLISSTQPNATLLYRASLNLKTSFSGSDLLRILIETGSNGATDNATGILEPTFGSVLDFSVKPPRDGDFGIGRAYYTFQPASNISVSLGPDIRVTDYMDQNSYANRGFREFTTLAFVNNLVLIPVSGPAAGAAIEWSIVDGLNLRALYAAADAGNPGQTTSYRGTASFVPLLYPVIAGNSGLFGNTYQGAIELQYAPSRSFAARLQYSGGEIFGNRFDAAGVNVELTLTKGFALFGRYGYSNYRDTAFGNLNPQYWMAGVTFLDLFKKGGFAGIAVGQPFMEGKIGNATQTNCEVFYNFPINDNISITPLIQVVTNSSNRAENGILVTGTVRTVFSF